MKKYLLLLIVTASACTAVQPVADLPRLGESTWKLTAIAQKPVNFGDRAFLKFDEKENKVSGKAVCNSFFSEYEMIGHKITFPAIGSTKMYCEGIMDEENQFITAMHKVKRYEVKSNFLYLYSSDALLLTFKRQPGSSGS